MILIGNNTMVQTLSAKTPNYPFRARILPGTFSRSDDLINAHRLYPAIVLVTSMTSHNMYFSGPTGEICGRSYWGEDKKQNASFPPVPIP